MPLHDQNMRLRIADDVIFRDLAGEAVLLHLSTSTYFGLDAIGTRLWHLIGEHGSIASAITTLQSEYDVDELRLRQDIEALINQLLAKGLLTVDAERSQTAH